MPNIEPCPCESLLTRVLVIVVGCFDAIDNIQMVSLQMILHRRHVQDTLSAMLVFRRYRSILIDFVKMK